MVSFKDLPPRARAIARKIGPLISNGYTLAEIGRHFGKSEDWASTRVRELRQAIAEQALERADEIDPELRSKLRAALPGSTAAPAAGDTTPTRRTESDTGTTPSAA